MLEYLTEISLKHKQWISYVVSFGCNPTTAEDLVQEMYIKVNYYLKKTNKRKKDLLYQESGELNFFFIYITLKNMFYDLKRKEKNLDVINIRNIDITENEYYLQNKYERPVKDTIEQTFTKHKIIEDYLLNDDYIELNSVGKIENYSNEKFGAFYKRKVFEEVFIKGNSIRKFSKDSGITYYSVYNTIKNIKKELNEIYKNRRLDSIHNEMDGNKMDSEKDLG